MEIRVVDIVAKARDSSTAFHFAQNDNKKSDYYLTVMLSIVETSKKTFYNKRHPQTRPLRISLRSNITRALHEYHFALAKYHCEALLRQGAVNRLIAILFIKLLGDCVC